MKAYLLFLAIWVLVGLGVLFAAIHSGNIVSRSGTEWNLYMNIPPCKDTQNLQVIWPAKAGAPIEIECDDMGTK